MFGWNLVGRFMGKTFGDEHANTSLISLPYIALADGLIQ
jgi:hypothetical protein